MNITENVKNVLAAGESLMSLNLQGGGENHQKDTVLTISSKEGPDPPLLELSISEAPVNMSPSAAPMGPAQVTGLQATAGDTSITLTWDVGTSEDLEPITYNVYRYDRDSTDNSTNYVVKSMGLIAPTYTDYRVGTNSTNILTPFTYVVAAVDIAGDESIQSDNVTVPFVSS